MMTIIRVNRSAMASHAAPMDAEASVGLAAKRVCAMKDNVSVIPVFPNAMGKNAVMTVAAGFAVPVTAVMPASPENA